MHQRLEDLLLWFGGEGYSYALSTDIWRELGRLLVGGFIGQQAATLSAQQLVQTLGRG